MLTNHFSGLLQISKETYEDKTKELVAVERELRKEKIQQVYFVIFHTVSLMSDFSFYDDPF